MFHQSSNSTKLQRSRDVEMYSMYFSNVLFKYLETAVKGTTVMYVQIHKIKD